MSKLILYLDVGLMGVIALLLFRWQMTVLQGRAMKNPDGSVDDWHEQKILYGIAIADLLLAVPLTMAGVVLIYLGWGIGFYIMGLASFWFLWVNTATTLTSLRFQKPRVTFSWFLVFPFGAILG
ncbi:MAG: hypothetical protein WBH56_17555, partial [Bacteroidota bacterium]